MSLIPWKGKQRDIDWEEWMERSPVGSLRREMDRLFDRFFGAGEAASGGELSRAMRWMPSLDVAETEKEVTVRAELPGVDPKDIDISISGQTLTVSGEKKEVTERRGESSFHSERCFGAFRRTVPLPVPVDEEKASAEYKKGVLTIRLTKSASAMPKRISVRAGE